LRDIKNRQAVYLASHGERDKRGGGRTGITTLILKVGITTIMTTAPLAAVVSGTKQLIFLMCVSPCIFYNSTEIIPTNSQI
jgi:hypothetical protein